MIIIDDDHQKLLQRSMDEDTRIRSARYFRVDGISILLEEWRWEAISGSTAVFLTEQVAAMDDAALKEFLRGKAALDMIGGVTVSRQESHVFVNFGFEAH